MAFIARNGDSGEVVTIAATGTTSNAFDARGDITFGVFIPTGFEGTSIGFTTCHVDDGTFITAYDAAGVALAVVVSDPGYFPLPAELAAVSFFKIVSNATETSERALRVVSKG